MKIIKGNIGSITGFVSMSDGSAVSLYDKRNKRIADVVKKIMKMTSYIDIDKMESQLLDSFNTVIKQSTLDDCSISIMHESSFRGYKNLSFDEKISLLFLDPTDCHFKKRFQRYDSIINYLTTPQSLKGISKKICLKPKYTKKYLTDLINMNYIESKDGIYRLLLI